MFVKLGMKHQVQPKLISERLLSDEDKQDILAGLVSYEALDAHVKVWKESGMCDYANGSFEKYKYFGAYLAEGKAKGGVK